MEEAIHLAAFSASCRPAKHVHVSVRNCVAWSGSVQPSFCLYNSKTYLSNLRLVVEDGVAHEELHSAIGKNKAADYDETRSLFTSCRDEYDKDRLMFIN